VFSRVDPLLLDGAGVRAAPVCVCAGGGAPAGGRECAVARAIFRWDASASESTLVADVEGALRGQRGTHYRSRCAALAAFRVAQPARHSPPFALRGRPRDTNGGARRPRIVAQAGADPENLRRGLGLGHDSETEGECLGRRNCARSRPCAGPIGLYNNDRPKRGGPP
jgi:hypothetical protein